MKVTQSRLWARYKTKVTFVIIGGWNTLFGYGVFVFSNFIFEKLLVQGFAAYMTAAVLSNFLAVTNAFIFHKYITFKSHARGWQILNEYIRFSMTYMVNFIIGLVLLPVLVEWGRLTPQIAAALIIMICAILSYIGHSRFSFRLKGGT